MRSILLHIADDAGLAGRTQVALDLARAFGGHVTCLQAVPYEYGVPGDIYGAVVAELLPAVRAAADKLRAECEARLRGEDVAWSWEQCDGRALEHLLRASALSDVVVVGSREPVSAAPSLLARDLATRMATPMLLVPEHAKALDANAPALVAWNGSDEASRALKAAVPLLAKAQSVVLASVREDADDHDLPAVEGAEYLSRHGIRSEIVESDKGEVSIAEQLTAIVEARRAGVLVMGAYGRPRVVETVLGGTTRDLLAEPPVPLLTCR